MSGDYDPDRLGRRIAKIYWSREELKIRCFRLEKVKDPTKRVVFEKIKVDSLKCE